MHTTRNRTLMIAAVILLSSAYAWAISEGGAIFLMIRPGARPSGMGSAFCAIADDATATYYNPAGLAFLKRNDPLLNYQDIKDWNRFLSSFKDSPVGNVFAWADFKDPEGTIIKLSGSLPRDLLFYNSVFELRRLRLRRRQSPHLEYSARH